MNKKEFIGKYGEDAYNKRQKQSNQWRKQHPEVVERNSNETHRKGGKYYEKQLLYNQTGIQGERNRIRKNHGNRWRPYKNIIAPDSQIHHQWMPHTAEYTGVALVERDQHMHGYIDVIRILEGEITLFTEKGIKGGSE